MRRKIWIAGIWGYAILQAVSGLENGVMGDVEIIGEDFTLKEQFRMIYRFINTKLSGHGLGILQRLLETGLFDRYYRLTQYDFNEYDENDIVLFNSALMHYYSAGYLRRMRKRIKNAKFILYIIDPMPEEAGGVWGRITQMQGEFDKILTAHPYNTKHYGFQYLPYIYTPPALVTVKQEPKDLFFCGTIDDQRYDMIKHFLEICRQKDVSYEAHLFKAEKYEKIEDKDVYYGLIDYDENVSKALYCNCILEIVRENFVGFTQRYYEAVVFNKKLLTNNPNIKELEYYDERFIQYFETIDGIDWDWVKEVCEVDYGYQGDFSPEKWEERLLYILE